MCPTTADDSPGGGPVAAVSAAVLCGGRSTRMGADKATLPHAGRVLARHVADALERGGAAAPGEVRAIGGRSAELAASGLVPVADLHPGEGPLGGIVTALVDGAARGCDVVVVMACDMPAVDAALVRELVRTALEADADVVTARARGDSGPQPLCSAWRVQVALDVLGHELARGERAVHRAWTALRRREVEADPAALRNVNRPEDLLEM